jgi:uncharacterized damage-inducible protein DinB
MKEILQEFSTYNVWAGKLLLDRIQLLTEAQIHEEIVSSFPGLYKTVLHMLDAESIWWQRLRLQERIVIPSQEPPLPFAELSKKLLQQSGLWQEWVRNASEPAIQHVFAYQNSKKEQFKQPVYQVLLHLFNHGTYHRGQMVTLLRQLGITDIPQTDFIIWSRTKK